MDHSLSKQSDVIWNSQKRYDGFPTSLFLKLPCCIYCFLAATSTEYITVESCTEEKKIEKNNFNQNTAVFLPWMCRFISTALLISVAERLNGSEVFSYKNHSVFWKLFFSPNHLCKSTFGVLLQEELKKLKPGQRPVSPHFEKSGACPALEMPKKFMQGLWNTAKSRMS